MTDTTLLDNPAWSALTTAQAPFAQGAPEAKRYLPGILPFAGFPAAGGANGSLPSSAAAGLDPFIAAGETFYIIGSRPPLPAGWTVELALPCAQLLAPENLYCMPQPTEEILLLKDSDRAEMYALINGIQPGYYHPDTPRLGDYCGIRRNGRLIAMAGERMRVTGFNELSAICTHPEYTGHGYAQQLIAWLCRRQQAAGITSFLHVSLANERALRLYIHLGFRHRREIVFTRLRKA
jgi:ribosomal protein S18 acetylase RimI-like enzyme